jgi:lysophospholipase L1-like esterase
MVWKRFFLVLLGIGIALFLLESAVRVRFGYYGSEADRIRYLYSLREIRHHQARLSGAPYLTYGLTPGYPTQNTRGFRGSEIAVPKPPGVFRIVALGGSTTYGDHIAKWEDAYPAQLERVLRERQRQVEVINAGVPGYSSWEMLISLEFQILDLQPDLLLVYEGINDLYPRLVRPSQYNGLATSKGVWRTDAPVIPASSLYRFLAIRLGWMDDLFGAQSQFDRSFSAEYCAFNATFTRCNNFNMTPDEVLAANPPRYFERNVRNLITIARSNDIQVMLSSWAYFSDAIPEVANGTFMTLGFVQQTVAEHNRILRNVSTAMRVPLYDLANSLPRNRAFWIEGMHLAPEGAHQQAVLYADFLTNLKLVP